MDYEIEKGIPCPPNSAGTNNLGRTKYPFAEMSIGDSFAYPQKTKHNTVGVTVCRAAKKLGFKFVTRKVDGIIRVWRVA